MHDVARAWWQKGARTPVVGVGLCKRALCGAVLALIMFALTLDAQAGKIVLANDEWTLSNTGFVSPNDPGTFATNVVSWFTGGGPATLHAYSTNFGLTQASLSSAMTGAGHAWTTGVTTFTFDLPTLLTYDAIFLAGNAADNGVLIDYVEAGGNVYLAGGTGLGGAAAEAARWNTFLNHFGLGLGSPYNGLSGSILISNPHPIFAGVDHLFQNSGSDTLDILISDPGAVVLVASGSHGLYAAFDSTAAVPEPSTMLLLGSGLAGLAVWRRKKMA